MSDKHKLKAETTNGKNFESGIPQKLSQLNSNKENDIKKSENGLKPKKVKSQNSFLRSIFKSKKTDKKIDSKNKASSNEKSSVNAEINKLDVQVSASEKKLQEKIKQFKDTKRQIKSTLKEQKTDVKKLWGEQKKEVKKINLLKQKYSKRIIYNHEIIPHFTKDKPNLEENIIELKNAYKYYILGTLKNVVINNISLDIQREKIITILGPSGSGKTTLLNLMSGLDSVNQGDVFVDGYNLSLLKDSHLTLFRRKKIAFIFQQYNLLPHLTAKENAEVGENLADKKKSSLSLNKIFETIEMTEHMNKYPYQLSGGQQQRISIARALAKNPSILFCDEPTGALDEKTGKKVLEILVKINKEFKTTIIIVTHNPAIAEISDWIIKIHDGAIDSKYENKNIKSPQDIVWA
ncbi:ABC transporter ATP-binding protein [Mycoplasma sp. SG1]|uniref:ABC transporter ATP-binding protein n=1 Tax=Mycoplasma sp. SG1 TaxID=2810348 RepID=UPI0020259CE0|nr:ATP-binding cassette domain-containing protein [Mycoplasma sp. SG1]URM52813.1 ATP-binding cassette domain-containing protein [Mycoplasma sp. SG1]